MTSSNFSFIAIPMIIFYVVGCPIAAFVILYKNRHRLNHPDVLRYIILLYQGLRHEVYYWELVNTLRKCLLLSLHVFIPDEYRIMKALVGVFIMFMITLLQARIRPFKIMVVSRLEHREMVCSLLTLYGGIIFAQKEHSLSALSLTFFMMILISNCRFLILWVFCMTTVFKKRKYAEILGKWIKKTFCLSVDEMDEEYLCYRSKLTTTMNSKGGPTKQSKATHMALKSQQPTHSILHSKVHNRPKLDDETYEVYDIYNKFVSDSERNGNHIFLPAKNKVSKTPKHHHLHMTDENPIKRRIKVKKGRRAVKGKKNKGSAEPDVTGLEEATDPNQSYNMVSMFGEELHSLNTTNRQMMSTTRKKASQEGHDGQNVQIFYLNKNQAENADFRGVPKTKVNKLDQNDLYLIPLEEDDEETPTRRVQFESPLKRRKTTPKKK